MSQTEQIQDIIDSQDEKEFRYFLKVDESIVGYIIGKGGKTIKKIASDSKAKISYIEDTTSFRITGQPLHVTRAAVMITRISMIADQKKDTKKESQAM